MDRSSSDANPACAPRRPRLSPLGKGAGALGLVSLLVLLGLASACGGDGGRPMTAPRPPEDCDNGIDDDRDGAIDCADPDCDGVPPCAPEDCDNGIDEDGDGLIDCDDPGCTDDPACPEDCDNGIDDDADGAIDCADSECDGIPPCAAEICDNGIDEDGDGLIDCDDPGCTDAAACPEDCLNGVDDDADGFVDCEDIECIASPDCAFCSPDFGSEPACWKDEAVRDPRDSGHSGSQNLRLAMILDRADGVIRVNVSFCKTPGCPLDDPTTLFQNQPCTRSGAPGGMPPDCTLDADPRTFQCLLEDSDGERHELNARLVEQPSGNLVLEGSLELEPGVFVDYRAKLKRSDPDCGL